MTDYEVPPHQVPGWLPALNAFVEKFGGECLDETVQHVTVILAAAVPHIRAELLADLADEMVEVAPTFAEMLDTISYEMREAITR